MLVMCGDEGGRGCKRDWEASIEKQENMGGSSFCFVDRKPTFSLRRVIVREDGFGNDSFGPGQNGIS